MSTFRYITTLELTGYTPLQETVHESLLLPFQDIAQRRVDKLLGKTLSSALKEYLNNKPVSVLPAETKALYDELFEKIKPANANLWLWHSFPSLEIKLTNKGLVNKSSAEQSVPAEASRIASYRQTIKDMAEDYLNELKEFLTENKTVFGFAGEHVADTFDFGLYIPKTTDFNPERHPDTKRINNRWES